MGLLHSAGPVVGAGVPVGIEEAQRVRLRGGVTVGQRHHQLVGLAGSGELAELAADIVLTSGARSRPSTRPSAAGGMRVAPSARGSPASARNTSVSSVAASP
ncbi:MAG TPA: hypothetical protein VF940_27920 [Streptosporangiaceae bacterium]